MQTHANFFKKKYIYNKTFTHGRVIWVQTWNFLYISCIFMQHMSSIYTKHGTCNEKSWFGMNFIMWIEMNTNYFEDLFHVLARFCRRDDWCWWDYKNDGCLSSSFRASHFLPIFFNLNLLRTTLIRVVLIFFLILYL